MCSSDLGGPRLWERLRAARPSFTCAKLFWWYNMYSTADWSVTPRPMYPADGRKVFDITAHPLALRDELKRDLGEFPFPAFWGPAAGIASSEWIARSAEWIEERHRPDLSLVYLPHLDYNLQRLGPDDPRIAADCAEIDRVAGDPSALKLGGEKREMTLLFCDVRGFTTISEMFDAEGLTRLINRFLSPMTEIILANNGYTVVNLGIKILPETLIQAYREHQPDAIGLSGLLVKSTQQMVITAEDFKTAGINVPLLVGGAALVTYPALLSVGLSPVIATVCNLVALTPGNFLAALYDRGQLPPIDRSFASLVIASLVLVLYRKT